jgi:hypothetical protein
MRILSVTIASGVGKLPADLKDLKIIREQTPNGTFHAIARHTEISLYPMFFKEAKKTQKWALGHELGHWFFNNSPIEIKRQIITFERGTGFWQNAMTSEEGFADMFSTYLFTPNELKAKYPEQYVLLARWIGGNKSQLRRFIDETIDGNK